MSVTRIKPPKNRPRRAELPEGDLAADRVVSLGTAVRLIASKLPAGRGDDVRAVEDRVRNRMRAAVKSNIIPMRSDGNFVIGHVTAWARGVPAWSGLFLELPAIQSAGADVLGQVTSRPSATVKPGSAESRARLADAMNELDRLRGELSASQAEANALRPDAEAYRVIRDKARTSAQRKRPRGQ